MQPQKQSFLLIATTDGRRPLELERLIESVASCSNVTLIILFQNDSEPPPPKSTQANLVFLRSHLSLPLSDARNIILNHIKQTPTLENIAKRSVLMLADDDCWYPNGFFGRTEHLDSAIHIFNAKDPQLNRSFSTFDLSKKQPQSILRPWELMFYAVSISIGIPYSICESLRFHESFGLGHQASQGEESLFLFQLINREPNINIRIHPELAVFHPWKMSTNSKNHASLAYFLGWCVRNGYRQVIPYYLYSLTKYLAANIIKPKPLYRSIFTSFIIDFIRGVRNTLNIP